MTAETVLLECLEASIAEGVRCGALRIVMAGKATLRSDVDCDNLPSANPRSNTCANPSTCDTLHASHRPSAEAPRPSYPSGISGSPPKLTGAQDSPPRPAHGLHSNGNTMTEQASLPRGEPLGGFVGDVNEVRTADGATHEPFSVERQVPPRPRSEMIATEVVRDRRGIEKGLDVFCKPGNALVRAQLRDPVTGPDGQVHWRVNFVVEPRRGRVHRLAQPTQPAA